MAVSIILHTHVNRMLSVEIAIVSQFGIFVLAKHWPSFVVEVVAQRWMHVLSKAIDIVRRKARGNLDELVFKNEATDSGIPPAKM